MKSYALLLALLSAPQTSFAVESLKAWDSYKDHLTAKYLKADARLSAEALDNATAELKSHQSEFARTLRQDPDFINKNKSQQESVLLGLTGSKQETYCRGAGMVELKAELKNGTKARVVLVNAHRSLGDSYANVKDGSWDYEVSLGSEAPLRSTSTMIMSDDRSFRMKEIRERKGDSGQKMEISDYEVRWVQNRPNYLSISSENPTRLSLGTDFLMWGGNNSQGRLIDFRVGTEKNFSKVHVATLGEPLTLTSRQSVLKKLPMVTIKDSVGVGMLYMDCYLVKYEIQAAEEE